MKISRNVDYVNVILETGNYLGTFKKWKEKQRNVTKRTSDGKLIKSDQLEDVILFVYETYGEEGVTASFRQCTPCIGKRANLRKELDALSNGAFSPIADMLVADNKISDEEVLRQVVAFIESKIGAEVSLKIEKLTNKEGEDWNKCTDISALPKGIKTSKSEPETSKKNDAFDNDDLPW